jgi:signal transduction histidine kinase
MQFDDRLATVLRMRTDSLAGERTQFRQLLDLLGTTAVDAARRHRADQGYARLLQLGAIIPPDEQAQILREPGLRLRSALLVEFLAEGEPRPAAAAMAAARLSEPDWVALIPRLPLVARGFLRHRRDLPPGAVLVLKRLGVGDLALTDGTAARPVRPFAAPAPRTARPPARPPTPPPPPAPNFRAGAPRDSEPISGIIERIEQFREARRPPPPPRHPSREAPAPDPGSRIDSFDLVTDAGGRAVWASAPVAPWIVGMLVTAAPPGPLARFNAGAAEALRHRLPLFAQHLSLEGAPAIGGDWRIDAAPVFDAQRGTFAGYRCRLHRLVAAPLETDPSETSEDRMRQVLHELRTPVNAIQGFAEIIQQQLFGPVPHEYRALAASIAVDSAKLLAGFDELDRLSRLEGGAMALDWGTADLHAVLDETLRRLGDFLRARHSDFDVKVSGSRFIMAIDHDEARLLCWRMLASAVGALAPGERLRLDLRSAGPEVRLEIELPVALRATGDGDRPGAAPRGAISAGMFGPRFALRLATAEARAAGGALQIGAETMRLTMPVLTDPVITHSRHKGLTGA